MRNYLTLLQRRPNFRSLWLAQVISLTGDWFNTIASVILINRLTASGLAVGGLFIARALPPFLLSPIAGVVADRFDRRIVLIVSDLLRAGIVMCFLLVDRPERLWLLYLLTVLQFSVSAFFEPARAAIMPTLVQGDELLEANTLSSITWSAMLTLGGAIGGLTASLFGVPVSLVVDALTFLVSAALLLIIPGRFRAASPHVLETDWQKFMDGLRYLRQNLHVGVVTLVKALGQVGSFDIIAALYAAHVFRVGQDGATTLGLMFTSFGVGAVIGPLIANRFGDSSAVWLRRAILGGIPVHAPCLADCGHRAIPPDCAGWMCPARHGRLDQLDLQRCVTANDGAGPTHGAGVCLRLCGLHPRPVHLALPDRIHHR